MLGMLIMNLRKFDRKCYECYEFYINDTTFDMYKNVDHFIFDIVKNIAMEWHPQLSDHGHIWTVSIFYFLSIFSMELVPILFEIHILND